MHDSCKQLIEINNEITQNDIVIFYEGVNDVINSCQKNNSFGPTWLPKQILANKAPIIDPTEKDDLKIGLLVGLADLGIKVGCVTNSIRKTATMMLELTGQISFIENLLTNEDVEIPKPNCEGYEKAMSIFKVTFNNFFGSYQRYIMLFI